jgi:hypothetical protein
MPAFCRHHGSHVPPREASSLCAAVPCCALKFSLAREQSVASTRGFILNFFTAALDILPESLHRIATRDCTQHSRQHQYCQDSLKHDLSPVSFSCTRLRHMRMAGFQSEQPRLSFGKPAKTLSSAPRTKTVRWRTKWFEAGPPEEGSERVTVRPEPRRRAQHVRISRITLKARMPSERGFPDVSVIRRKVPAGWDYFLASLAAS